MLFYVATFVLLTRLRFPWIQWTGLICVTVATIAIVAIWERGRWPLGLFVPPRLAIPEAIRGVVWGAVLVGLAALLVVLSTNLRHEPGRGFPWLELVTVFIPAAVHEELLFRGYGFQKLHGRFPLFALFFVAFFFAWLHAGNEAVTSLGLINIFLGGLLLGLAYQRYGRLWFPIGLHLAWNLMSGPILGHEVSGYEALQTLFREVGGGPELLTGGEFGIEGSIWMTVVELCGVGLLWRTRANAERRMKNEEGAFVPRI